MGYTTDFYGEFNLTPSLTDEQSNYIKKFNKTRRMKRDVNKLMELDKGMNGYLGRTTGTPEEIYGTDGQFYVGGTGSFGQDNDDSVIDYNRPPGKPSYEETRNIPFNEMWENEQKLIKEGKCQPGLWCQWTIEGENNVLAWDGNEKFYEYTAWLQYLITNFFQPWGVMVNGEVEFQGEDRDDRGKIVVTDNQIQVLKAYIEYR